MAVMSIAEARRAYVLAAALQASAPEEVLDITDQERVCKRIVDVSDGCVRRRLREEERTASEKAEQLSETTEAWVDWQVDKIIWEALGMYINPLAPCSTNFYTPTTRPRQQAFPIRGLRAGSIRGGSECWCPLRGLRPGGATGKQAGGCS
jgi:hypothetical protein